MKIWELYERIVVSNRVVRFAVLLKACLCFVFPKYVASTECVYNIMYLYVILLYQARLA